MIKFRFWSLKAVYTASVEMKEFSMRAIYYYFCNSENISCEEYLTFYKPLQENLRDDDRTQFRCDQYTQVTTKH